MHRITHPSLFLSLVVLAGSTTLAQERVYQFGEFATHGDDFGRAVSDVGDLDGDGVTDLLVGAPFDDNAGTNAGVVWVHSGATGDVLWWRLGDWAGDNFGWALDSLGDINGDGTGDYIVGAPGWDNGGTWQANSGAVYVISGETGATIAFLPTNQLNANQGYAVRGLGDITGDGVNDYAYSTPFFDINGLTDNGSVTVHSGAGTQYLFARYGQENSAFYGYSIGAARATSSPATSRILVGAPGVDGLGVDRGQGQLLDGNGTTHATFPGSTDHEWFGATVAEVGDANKDGWTDFAIAAPYADILFVGADAGSVKVFSGISNSYLFSITGATAGANFGQSLAGCGDFDGDGWDDLLIGAPNDDSGAVDGGEARLVSGRTGATMHSWTGGVNDHMGRAVSSAGDLNGDGHEDIIFGADDAPFGAGEAYVHLSHVDAPMTYCVAKDNSQNCTPQIASSGVPSLSIANDFHVTASNVISQKFGILFWGAAAHNAPFLDGTLCVLPPLQRTAPQNSGGNAWPDDCSGLYDFHFSHTYMADTGMLPGDRVYAQFWSRDPAASFQVGLTDATAFDVVP